MNCQNLSETMKLRKRFIIICVLLFVVFLFQTLYFYSNPRSDGPVLSEVLQEVVSVPIKSNKTIVYARNLFQGIKMHQQNMKNKNKTVQKITSILNFSSHNNNGVVTIKKTKRSDTSQDLIHIDQYFDALRTDNKLKDLNTNLNVLVTSNIEPQLNHVTKRQQDFLSNLPSHNRGLLTKTAGTINYDKSFTKYFKEKVINYTRKIIDSEISNNQKPHKHSKNKNFKYNNTLNKKSSFGRHRSASKFNVDKDAFAADAADAIVNMNQPPPMKKQSSFDGTTFKKEQDEDHQNETGSSAFDAWTPSVKDHRIFGRERSEMTKEEILFGTLKSRNLSTLVDEVRVVSMSLYGSENRYLVGALKNAGMIKKNFPGWKLRFYVESPLQRGSRYGHVPQKVLDNLRNMGADIHYIVPEEDFLPPMMWRFLVADDLSVDRFIIRDSDSRLTSRDYESVQAWMQSGQPFHCIRDHPSHSGQSISGGLWGGESHKLRIILRSSWIDEMRGLSSGYFTDMSFLQHHIWPKVASYAYCSDSVSCDRWPNSFPFPVRRYGYDHVGEVYDERDIGRQEDIRILRRTGENEWCLPPYY